MTTNFLNVKFRAPKRDSGEKSSISVLPPSGTRRYFARGKTYKPTEVRGRFVKEILTLHSPSVGRVCCGSPTALSFKTVREVFEEVSVQASSLCCSRSELFSRLGCVRMKMSELLAVQRSGQVCGGVQLTAGAGSTRWLGRCPRWTQRGGTGTSADLPLTQPHQATIHTSATRCLQPRHRLVGDIPVLSTL